MVVGDQFWVELVGLALHETVESVETSCERPLVERSSCRALLHRGEMPLADDERGVARIAEHFSHRGGVVGNVAEHVGEPGPEVRHRPHANGVLRSTGEQRRPRRRAQRGDVKVGELQPVGGEGVDVRGVDGGAVASELREPGVVEQHDHHVRRVIAGVRRFVVIRGRVGHGAPDGPFES